MFNPQNPNYDKQKILQQEWEDNKKDYGGFGIDLLYIGNPKYKNIKMELFESNMVSIKNYHEEILPKVNTYTKTKAVKGLKPHILGNVYGNNNYGVGDNDKVSFGQLLSVICYCDLSDFSCYWSSSFRFIRFNESLSSIKERNSKLYNISKAFIQLVSCFGISGVTDLEDFKNPNGMESSSYYCGLNMLLSFPSYVLRLNGPCSSSKHIEVATRFAKRQGLIITIKNYEPWLHFFDCSWISNYREEDERVFVAGTHPVQIVNIQVIETAKTYKKLCKSLYLFDQIVNGQGSADMDSSVSIGDIKYLKRLLLVLFDNDLGIIGGDIYLYQLLKSYQINKKQIVINLDYLYDYECESVVKDELLSIVIDGELKRYEYDSDISDILHINLIKLWYLIKLFPSSLQTIIIYTTDPINGYSIYPFCLSSLFGELRSLLTASKTSLQQIQIRATRYWNNKDNPCWIVGCFNKLSLILEETKFQTQLLQKQGVEDILYINIV